MQNVERVAVGTHDFAGIVDREGAGRCGTGRIDGGEVSVVSAEKAVSMEAAVEVITDGIATVVQAASQGIQSTGGSDGFEFVIEDEWVRARCDRDVGWASPGVYRVNYLIGVAVDYRDGIVAEIGDIDAASWGYRKTPGGVANGNESGKGLRCYVDHRDCVGPEIGDIRMRAIG